MPIYCSFICPNEVFLTFVGAHKSSNGTTIPRNKEQTKEPPRYAQWMRSGEHLWAFSSSVVPRARRFFWSRSCSNDVLCVLVTTPWLHEWKEVASQGGRGGTAIYGFHRDVPLWFSLLLWKNNTRCSESALQLRLDFSFMVFKQFTLGSESLGLD